MLKRYFGLTGKRALITGGSSGLGLAISEAFVEAGAEVIIAGNQTDQVRAEAARIGATGLIAELGTREASLQLAKDAGEIDILVSNAGIEGPVTGLADLEEDAYLRVFDVNLHAATWLTSIYAPQMARRNGGSIILMASLSALRGNRAIAVYSMSKAALTQLARNIAVQFGPDNVRANAIAPGFIETTFSKPLMNDTGFMERRLNATPLRRVGQPKEIAATALWLAGPGGTFVTGQTIVVDGGTLVSDGS